MHNSIYTPDISSAPMDTDVGTSPWANLLVFWGPNWPIFMGPLEPHVWPRPIARSTPNSVDWLWSVHSSYICSVKISISDLISERTPISGLRFLMVSAIFPLDQLCRNCGRLKWWWIELWQTTGAHTHRVGVLWLTIWHSLRTQGLFLLKIHLMLKIHWYPEFISLN